MPFLIFLRRIPALLSPRGWIAVGVLAAFLAFGGYCAHRAVEAERAKAAAEQAEAEARAASARETASGERLNDTLTIRDRQKERDDAAHSLPDSIPDDRELRRRCRQLRDAGRTGFPACAGFEG